MCCRISMDMYNKYFSLNNICSSLKNRVCPPQKWRCILLVCPDKTHCSCREETGRRSCPRRAGGRSWLISPLWRMLDPNYKLKHSSFSVLLFTVLFISFIPLSPWRAPVPRTQRHIVSLLRDRRRTPRVMGHSEVYAASYMHTWGLGGFRRRSLKDN